MNQKQREGNPLHVEVRVSDLIGNTVSPISNEISIVKCSENSIPSCEKTINELPFLLFLDDEIVLCVVMIPCMMGLCR